MRISTGLMAAFLVAALPAAPMAATDVPEQVETRVGQLVMIKLPGSPRAGYKWELNRQLSTGLDMVKVDLLGWLITPDNRTVFFGKPSVMNVAVKGLAPGKAALTFDYYKTWGRDRVVKSATVKVVVKPEKK